MAPSLSSTPNPSRGSRPALPSPMLPIEIVEEIICRLPVKFLSQLRCVCKSWNSLISDPKFARRHLHRSNRRFLLVKLWNCSRFANFMSYPLPSVLKAGATQLRNPIRNNYEIIDSCDGILCCCNFRNESIVLWNPCIEKIWKLTPFLKSLLGEDCDRREFFSAGFGYDHLSDSFKLIAMFYYPYEPSAPARVLIHNLGSNSWRRIEDFPANFPNWGECGKLVSGAVNWLVLDDDFHLMHAEGSIISLDLGKECYQELLQPDHGVEDSSLLILDVMRDCLCILADSDVWIMNEYGNDESWTKLFTFPARLYHYHSNFKISLSVCENDEMLFHSVHMLYCYNFKNGTFRSSDVKINDGRQIQDMRVEIESLISPYPQN